VTSIVTIHVPSEWDKTAPQRNAAAYQSLRQTEGVLTLARIARIASGPV